MRVLVIADDLTGSAEIGGIALRSGLSVEIVHAPGELSGKEVQIINTNTRSVSAGALNAHLKNIFHNLGADGFINDWDWIYLKFDSALRGHIVKETAFYRSLFAKKSVVFCPVNLPLSRVVKNGQYLIEGQPIAETDFAKDPEFPITSSQVLEAIHAGGCWEVYKEVPRAITKERPYVFCEVSTKGALENWARELPAEEILFAGAASFFEVMVQQKVVANAVGDEKNKNPEAPIVYVCGSKHINSRRQLNKVPEKLKVYWRKPKEAGKLATQLYVKIKAFGLVFFAVNLDEDLPAGTIREEMALVLAELEKLMPIHELVIEGGATAEASLEVLGVRALTPVFEYRQGVIRAKTNRGAMYITLKPGSYQWPDELWSF